LREPCRSKEGEEVRENGMERKGRKWGVKSWKMARKGRLGYTLTKS